ncbi:aryl hydrocarbon receptor nuclear translocator-like protein 2 isoform X2 [Oncorhynchus keta]|uniref:aryl hydrocarbon receptor nuclear translocator-like protein 2 isoform X2 n=1 Tax=Oncorhynchus keta TaxID=8018 RepID=UPI00227D54F1|nr:aryl hydrocarbon receptor nuclear translocator-like protein 2 isoform X2 [Oncorhynchus keta]
MRRVRLRGAVSMSFALKNNLGSPPKCRSMEQTHTRRSPRTRLWKFNNFEHICGILPCNFAGPLQLGETNSLPVSRPYVITPHLAGAMPDVITPHLAGAMPDVITPHKAGAMPDVITPHKAGAMPDVITPHKAGAMPDVITPNKAGAMPDVITPHKAGAMPIQELSRKRKGDLDNRENGDAQIEEQQSRSEDDDQQVKIKWFREPHSQIEKRRRDKMNTLIDELSAMIPSWNPMAKKLDKLTVLRMAVQHLKTLKGASSSFTDVNYKRKPSFLPQDDLKHLVLTAADGFLFVVSCDRGKILFTSESVSKFLNYSRLELIGQSLFDYVHPKDISKVKEQLSASGLYPRERLIDAKSSPGSLAGLQVQDLPVGAVQLCTGARRSFFCRMKHSRTVMKTEDKTIQPSSSKKKESQRYCTVHCTGYMRRWPSTQLDAESDDNESSHLSCLVAVCRVHPNNACQPSQEVTVKPTQFVTRFAIDGKFNFIDQQATTVLGYLPQELLGTSCYEYFHQDDMQHLTETHRKVLRSKEKIETSCYKFKTKLGSFIMLQSQWFSFINPWTKEVEFIVSTNRVLGPGQTETEQPSSSELLDEERKRTILIPGISSGMATMIYSDSIGTQIANELLDSNRVNCSPSIGTSSPFCPSQDRSPMVSSHANMPNEEVTDSDTVSKSGSESASKGATYAGSNTHMDTGESSQMNLDSMVGPGLGILSNNEAAMAVIMSLLQTDANLGDAVDFDNMHWSH